MNEETNTQATKTQLIAYSYFGGEAVVEFNEQGWELIRDTREVKVGYLHYEDGLSAPAITDAVRDQMVVYFYNAPQGMPGIGATPQQQYMADLSREDRERIGNNGKRAFYNR